MRLQDIPLSQGYQDMPQDQIKMWRDRIRFDRRRRNDMATKERVMTATLGGGRIIPERIEKVKIRKEAVADGTDNDSSIDVSLTDSRKE